MLALYLAMAARGAGSGRPALSALAVTHDGGSCSGPHRVGTAATVTASWSVSNPDDAPYEVQVAVNGGAPVTLANMAVTSYVVTPNANYVEGGINGQSLTTSFEVRIVRKADAVTVDSSSGSFTGAYGYCP